MGTLVGRWLGVAVCAVTVTAAAAFAQPAPAPMTLQLNLAPHYATGEVLERLPVPPECTPTPSTFESGGRTLTKLELRCGALDFVFVRDERAVWLTCGGGQSCTDCLAAAQAALALYDRGGAPQVIQGCPAESAPTPTAGAPTDLEAARIHFVNGVNLYTQDHNYAAALAEFQASYDLHHNPAVLLNIGLAYKELLRYPEAIAALQSYLASATNPRGEDATLASSIITDLELLLADVTVRVTPAGAAVLVDGREIGTAPLPRRVRLAAGPHVVEVRADGYKPASRSFTTSARVDMAVDIQLEAIPRTGKVRITASAPRATVVVDGEPAGIAPLELELGGGGHTLEVAAPRYTAYRNELVITAGQTRDVTITLDRPAPVRAESHWYSKWYVWAPIGAVAVGAGVGIYALTTPSDPVAGTLAPGVGNIH